MRSFLLMMALIVVNDSGFCGTIDPSIPDKTYIKYADDFKSVIKLCGSYKDGMNFCASAVAISDRYILTAAHVVHNYKEASIHVDDKKIKIKEFILKKEFDINKMGFNDIAIGICEENIGLKSYPDLYSLDDEIDKVCEIAGFGLNGTFATGANKMDNIKRAGTNKVEYILDHVLVCDVSRPREKNYTDKEFLIASGDSGGGLFIDGKLAGINSFVMARDKKPNSSYTDEGCHTRISIFKEWISSITK